MIDQDALTIGDVSKATGLAVTAIRYYEEKDLIAVSHREYGQRRFAPSVIGKLNFIKAAQKFGFTLEEIKQIIQEEPKSWRELLTSKIGELKTQQTEITSMIAFLNEIQKCGCEIISKCPKIETEA